MNRDKMYHFTLGFCIAILIAIIVVSYNPTPETEQTCSKCGSKAWWFQLAEGEDNEN